MLALTVTLFFGMLVCLEVGLRYGQRAFARSATAQIGIGALEAAIFALLGLLLGFAFATSMTRFQDRRQLVIQEANAIRKAYLRLDLLPVDQHAIRRLFRQYLDARIEVYQNVPEGMRDARVAEATQLQRRIWALAVEANKHDPTKSTALVVLPAINEMIDITTARTLFLRTHMPVLILVLICLVALLSALMAGYAMSRRRQRSMLHMVSYAACVSLTLFAALDLDNPGPGFIHLSTAEALLEELRHSIPP
jgi:ABC-type glycerol-3-phosphate transport system permease component